MYSPKIKPEYVVALYRLKQVLNKPITHLANEAICEYLNKKQRQIKEANKNER